MLYIVRGLPGAGKNTVAEKLVAPQAPYEYVISADDYFMEDGAYKFDASMIAEAHQWCQQRVKREMFFCDVAVANTFTQRWEMEPYIQMAKEQEEPFTVVDLYDGGLGNEELAARSVHNVPVETITQMRLRYEHCWRTGNPTPPWEREDLTQAEQHELGTVWSQHQSMVQACKYVMQAKNVSLKEARLMVAKWKAENSIS